MYSVNQELIESIQTLNTTKQEAEEAKNQCTEKFQ